jgi:hypothetical protein
MFAIFSLIKDVPQIYQIHIQEETCKKSIQELVHRYIIQKRNFENPDPLTLPLNEIKIETFTQYPNYTYLSIDSNTIEIYEHQLVDVVEKGWVWNGLTKSVSSQKIGYFQIQSVKEKDIVEPEITIEEINEEQLKMYQDIENLIDEMLRSIEKGNEELEQEKQMIQNLPDLIVPAPLPAPFTLSVERILPIIQTSKPIDIVPLVSSKDPLNSGPLNTDDLFDTKKNLLQIESKYLSFFDDEEDSINKQQEKETEKETEKERENETENLQEQIDLCDIQSSYPKCHWHQRGKGSNRYSTRRRGYVPSHGYSFSRLHLY